VESNLVLDKVTDSLQEADGTLSSVLGQVVDIKTALKLQVADHLDDFIHLVQIQDSGSTVQEQITSATEALGIVSRVDKNLDSVKITVNSVKLSSALSTGKSVESIWLYTSVSAVLWVVAIIGLGFMSLVCLPVCYLKLAMVLAILTILVMFAAAGISFALSVGISDFCVNPNENTVTYLSDLDRTDSQKAMQEPVNTSTVAKQFSSASQWPPTASDIPTEISITGDAVNSTSRLVTDINGTDYASQGSNLNVTLNDRNKSMPTPTVVPVARISAAVASGSVPAITQGPVTTNTGTISGSSVAFYVYCSNHCPNPFEKDFTVTRNQLNRLSGKLQQELLSFDRSQEQILKATDGVSSVKSSLLELEDTVQCDHLHKVWASFCYCLVASISHISIYEFQLYTDARDGVCNKGL
jgi:hypothetical protein